MGPLQEWLLQRLPPGDLNPTLRKLRENCAVVRKERGCRDKHKEYQRDQNNGTDPHLWALYASLVLVACWKSGHKGGGLRLQQRPSQLDLLKKSSKVIQDVLKEAFGENQ